MTGGVQFLRMQKLTGKGIVGAAARHNHREIMAEMGGTPGCSIDPRRTPLNRVLAGQGNAAGVVAEAQALMTAAGVGTLRKDAVRALEIVVSLPSETTIEQEAFFADAVRWAGVAIGAPVLSAVVHNDEAAPHAHILILPLVDGRMVGSDLMGNRAKLQALQADFQLKVAHRYGLARQAAPARPSAAQRREAVDMAFAALEANSGLQTAVLLALLEPHRANPLPLLQALGIAMPAPKRKAKASFVEIMTRPAPEKKPIGFANRKPIGFDADDEGAPSQTLSCVGFGDFHDPDFADRQPAQGMQNPLHTPSPTADQADTRLRFQEAQEIPAPARNEQNVSLAEGGVRKISDTPTGLQKIMDTPQAVHQLDTLAPVDARHQPGAGDLASHSTHIPGDLGRQHSPESSGQLDALMFQDIHPSITGQARRTNFVRLVEQHQADADDVSSFARISSPPTGQANATQYVELVDRRTGACHLVAKDALTFERISPAVDAAGRSPEYFAQQQAAGTPSDVPRTKLSTTDPRITGKPVPTVFVATSAPCANGSRPHKDVSKSGCISKGGGISPPPAGAPNFGQTYAEGVPSFGYTPSAGGDALKTQQVDHRAADDYQRHRDDDQPTDAWCADLGEFVQATGPPASRSHQQ